jgi:ketosteroid isomerase-like protein
METLTRTNTAIVKDAFADFSTGNIAGILEICSDTISWSSYQVPAIAYTKTYRGKKGVAEFFGTLAASVTYTEFTPKEFYESGNKVLVKVFQAATVNATGKKYAQDTIMEFTFETGTLTAFYAYFDSYEQSNAFLN